MLEHFFYFVECLCEFKFKFEFICLESKLGLDLEMQKKLEKESKTQSKPARPTLSSFLAQPATPFPFLPHRPKPRQPSSHPVFPWPSSVLRPSKFRPRPTAHGPFSLAPARGWPSATRSSRLRPRLSPLSACASPLSPHCSPGPPVGSISHLRLPRARATTGISGRNHRGFPSLLPRRDPRRSPLNHHETPPDPHPSHSAA